MKRVFWKKGMRLTDDVLRLSDNCHAELVGHALLLASAGRFGLMPAKQPFKISLDINKNIVEVIALNCLGITKEGQIIDISFDSRYSQVGDARAVIPSQADDRAYLLLVSPTGEWQDAGDNTCEPLWQFSLQEENIPVPGNALPLARIVNDMGWREDEIHFVPPCLLLSSHERYMSQCNRFRELIEKTEQLALSKLDTESGDALKILWPQLQRLSIVMDKESDIMSPMSLLARIQELIGTFHCACLLDQSLGLSEADKYAEYVRSPYNFADCYLKIDEGLSLTMEICHKLENITLEPQPSEPATPDAPYIKESDLHNHATSNNVRIEVSGIASGAVGYYSLDGSDPATPLQGGRFVPINPGFNKTRTHEDDKTYVVKLKSILGGQPSRVATFNLVVTKDVNVWKGFQI